MLTSILNISKALLRINTTDEAVVPCVQVAKKNILNLVLKPY